MQGLFECDIESQRPCPTEYTSAEVILHNYNYANNIQPSIIVSVD